MYTSGLYHKSEVNMTKKLIDRLEELADEMKVIVHQLRGPSTIDVGVDYGTQPDETVITFEGQQYKKVDREAREGDVVVLKSHSYTSFLPGKPYKVFDGVKIKSEKTSRHKGNLYKLYESIDRTPETVDVYELITEDKSKIKGIAIEAEAPKSQNQQRAEVIAKAMAFVDENGGDDYHFDIDEKKGTVFAYKVITPGVGRYGVKHGFSKCHPNDVFNADIGKAISFGRAKKLDVSEFENAVQPTEFAVGQNCVISNWSGHNGKELTITKLLDGKRANHSYMDGWLGFDNLTIINDTNAEYSEVNA